jgi:DNA-binding transcriptional MerR regulator
MSDNSLARQAGIAQSPECLSRRGGLCFRGLTMRIGELAKRANVNVQTLRFYEREGLLPKPGLTGAGYREYAKRDVDRVMFIRSCQEIGFTLKDVKEVFDLHRVLASPERSEHLKPKAQAEFLATAHRRLALIDEKLKILTQMKKDMQDLVATLEGQQKPVCPVSGLKVT